MAEKRLKRDYEREGLQTEGIPAALIECGMTGSVENKPDSFFVLLAVPGGYLRFFLPLDDAAHLRDSIGRAAATFPGTIPTLEEPHG